VPDLGPPSVGAAVEDDPAAHAGAEREEHHRRQPLPGAELPLRECGGIRVVLDRGRQPEPRPRVRAEVEVVERQVRRAQHTTRAAVEVRRDAEPECAHALVEERLHRLVDGLQHVLLRARGALDELPREDVALPVGEAGEDLGAADVHADDEGGAHDRGLR
jgi:hypothetical protein